MWVEGRFDLSEDNWLYRIHHLWELLEQQEKEKIHTVEDCGAGGQQLYGCIGSSMEYVPVDVIKRKIDKVPVIIRDYNKGEFYNRKIDCIVCSGILEYILCPQSFLENVFKYSKVSVLLAYNTLEAESNYSMRKEYGWVSHVSEKEIIEIATENGFSLTKIERFIDFGKYPETYFVFVRR